jgi:hypothetical protein
LNSGLCSMCVSCLWTYLGPGGALLCTTDWCGQRPYNDEELDSDQQKQQGEMMRAV